MHEQKKYIPDTRLEKNGKVCEAFDHLACKFFESGNIPSCINST